MQNITENPKSLEKFQLTVWMIFLAFGFINTLHAQTKVFKEATGFGKDKAIYVFDEWRFSTLGNRFEIRKDGTAKRINKKNQITNFRFNLNKDEELQRVIYFAQYQNDLIIIGELGNGESGFGFIIRLNGKTLKPKWRENIPAFNIPKGLIENQSVYLAGSGFIGKINLDTGNYIWKHDNLYRKYKESGAFNIFLTPQIKGDLIIFKEEDTNNEISANRLSGKIIRVLVN